MRPRNRELHAEVERICDLKEQMGSYKSAAERCHTSPEVIRVLVSREMIRRKLTNVNSKNPVPCGTIIP